MTNGAWHFGGLDRFKTMGTIARVGRKEWNSCYDAFSDDSTIIVQYKGHKNAGFLFEEMENEVYKNYLPIFWKLTLLMVVLCSICTNTNLKIHEKRFSKKNAVDTSASKVPYFVLQPLENYATWTVNSAKELFNMYQVSRRVSHNTSDWDIGSAEKQILDHSEKKSSRTQNDTQSYIEQKTKLTDHNAATTEPSKMTMVTHPQSTLRKRDSNVEALELVMQMVTVMVATSVLVAISTAYVIAIIGSVYVVFKLGAKYMQIIC